MSNALSTSVNNSEPGSPLIEGSHGPASDGWLSSGAENSERKAIERIMRTDIARYRREPELQERYLQLLREDEIREKGPDVVRGELARMRSPSEWAADGNDPRAYPQFVHLVRAVNDILSAISVDQRDAIGDSFEALPSAIHSAVFSELCDTRTVVVDPLNEDDLEIVLGVPAYKVLAKEWGQDAPHKLAKMRTRIHRVFARLGGNNRQRAIHWFDNLPTPGVIAIGRKLAG